MKDTAVQEYMHTGNSTRTEDARYLRLTTHQAVTRSSISLREDQDLPSIFLRFSRASEVTVQWPVYFP